MSPIMSIFYLGLINCGVVWCGVCVCVCVCVCVVCEFVELKEAVHSMKFSSDAVSRSQWRPAGGVDQTPGFGYVCELTVKRRGTKVQL